VGHQDPFVGRRKALGVGARLFVFIARSPSVGPGSHLILRIFKERHTPPYVTIEAVLPVGDKRLAIVNDNNFGSHGRNPVVPDYSDFIVVRVPSLR
jgi:hypothetical protein